MEETRTEKPEVEEEPGKSWWERLYIPEVLKGLGTTLGHAAAPDNEVTIEYPEKHHLTRPGYRGEHRLKKDEWGRPKCVACQLCATACPSHCIHIVGSEAPWQDRDKVPKLFEIDLMRCIYCGYCEEACPCDAIELTAQYNQVMTDRAQFVRTMEDLLDV